MKVPCSSVPVDRTWFFVLLCLCAQGPPLFPCDPHHGGFTSRLRKCISSDSDKVRKCRQTGSRSRKRWPVSQIGVFPSDDSHTEFSLNGSTPNKVPHCWAWIGTSSEHSVCLHWVWEIVWIVLKGAWVCVVPQCYPASLSRGCELTPWKEWAMPWSPTRKMDGMPCLCRQLCFRGKRVTRPRAFCSVPFCFRWGFFHVWEHADRQIAFLLRTTIVQRECQPS